MHKSEQVNLSLRYLYQLEIRNYVCEQTWCQNTSMKKPISICWERPFCRLQTLTGDLIFSEFKCEQSPPKWEILGGKSQKTQQNFDLNAQPQQKQCLMAQAAAESSARWW